MAPEENSDLEIENITSTFANSFAYDSTETLLIRLVINLKQKMVFAHLGMGYKNLFPLLPCFLAFFRM